MQFINDLKRLINTNSARSIILTGNVHDLFWNGSKYIPLIDLLSQSLVAEPTDSHKGILQLIYRLNRDIESQHMQILHEGWGRAYRGSLLDCLDKSGSDPTYGLELLRQIVESNRLNYRSQYNSIAIIEGVDLLVPESNLPQMSMPDRKRLMIFHDWFSSPEFINGGDTVIMISESRSAVHHRLSRLPQLSCIEIPLPDLAERKQFIEFMTGKEDKDGVAEKSAGLSIHALRQLILGGDLSPSMISRKVEEYMTYQLGEGVVEFKRPSHTLNDVIGFKNIKEFFRKELLPGFLAEPEDCVTGVAVSGPIGSGKTYICEAFASELNVPVITFKNIRSKWFGETDAIFERIHRLISTFNRLVIFIDEADTQFGRVDSDAHETERRLTGKIQAMMSDKNLRGKVIWFLMTARIHLLSPDMRRPGRIDYIIPILDPEGLDRSDFIRWAFCGLTENQDLESVYKVTSDYYAASFQMLRTEIKRKKCKTLSEALSIAKDIIPSDIGKDRNEQLIHAKKNCTRKSLLAPSY